MSRSTLLRTLLALCLVVGFSALSARLSNLTTIALAASPTITGVSPSYGLPGSQITVSGTNLTLVSDLTFGPEAANQAASVAVASTSFTSQSGTQITLVVPSGGVPGATVSLSGMTGGQQVPSTALFTVSVGSISFPASGGPSFSLGTEPVCRGIAGPCLTSINTDPAFYVQVANERPSGGLHGYWNEFTAELAVCEKNGGGWTSGGATEQNVLVAGSYAGSCTDPEGNTGSWFYVDETHLSEDTLGTYTLSLPTTGLFGPETLAQTVKLIYGVDWYVGHPHGVYSHGYSYTETSAFQIVVIPEAVVQLKTLPYTIVYQPPGNQSTASYATMTGYSTSVSVGSSASSSTKDGTEDSQSFSESFKVGLPDLGFSPTGGLGLSYDTTTEHGFGDNWVDQTANTQSSSLTFTKSTDPDPYLIPESGTSCPGISTAGNTQGQVQADSCSPLVSPPNAYETGTYGNSNIVSAYLNEPFWNDRFILLIHPQFGLYQFGSAPVQFDMIGAVPATAEITIWQLQDCRDGIRPGGINECNLAYADADLRSGSNGAITYMGNGTTLSLTPSEALGLLELDPFWSHGQGSNIAPSRAAPYYSPSYGASWSGTANASDIGSKSILNLTNTQASTSSQSGTTNYTATVTNVVGTTQSQGIAEDVQGNMASVTLTSTDKQTTSTSETTSYTDSTAVSNTLATTDTGTLDDYDTTTPGNGGPACKVCHFPLPSQPSTNIYLDRLFGGFMYQDPNAPGPPPICLTCLATERAAGFDAELAVSSFNNAVWGLTESVAVSDVAPQAPDRSAIAYALGTGMMSTNTKAEFQGSVKASRSDLIQSVAAALNVGTEAATKIIGKAGSSQSPVSAAELGAAFDKAFGLSKSEEKQLFLAAVNLVGPTGGVQKNEVSRSVLAAMLFGTMRARCLAGCHYSGGKFSSVLPFPRPQSIHFHKLSDSSIVKSPVSVSATASSGLRVDFQTETPQVCLSSGKHGQKIELIGKGICTVVASQSGNVAYSFAHDVARSFPIRDHAALANRKRETIRIEPVGSQFITSGAARVTADASSGLPVEFKTKSAAVCAVDAKTTVVRFNSVGECAVIALQPGNPEFSSAQPVTVGFAVLRANPGLSWPPLADMVYGTPLSTDQLDATSAVPGSFAYQPAPGTILHAGSQQLSAVFTPTDTSSYSGGEIETRVDVVPSVPALTWNPPADILDGTALSDVQLDATANTPGTFSYAPNDGTVLDAGQDQPLWANFFPDDSSDYIGGATVSTSINVDPGGTP